MAVDQSPCYPCIDTAVCTCINGVIQEDTRGTIASTNSTHRLGNIRWHHETLKIWLGTRVSRFKNPNTE
ncbi:hypothetical protein WN51_08665 [Melipona quadrifasciata]|uniref:Uncharacterized protein n=1 Tax=Melipona quadrifasciata TaxID=166423 RepID=A0A0M9A8Z2_9HYME|nr:hypothetical protein WN51_08665 [Melipona quadrifasciata]